MNSVRGPSVELVLTSAQGLVAELRVVGTQSALTDIFSRVPVLLDQLNNVRTRLAVKCEETPAIIASASKVADCAFDILGTVGVTSKSYETQLAEVQAQITTLMVEKAQKIAEGEMQEAVDAFKQQVEVLRNVDMMQLMGMSSAQKIEIGEQIRGLLQKGVTVDFEGKDDWLKVIATDCDLLFGVDVGPSEAGVSTSMQIEGFNRFLDWVFTQEAFTSHFSNGTFRQSGDAGKIAAGLEVFRKEGVDALMTFCAENEFAHNDFAVIIKQVFTEVAVGKVRRNAENLPVLTARLMSIFLHVDEKFYPYTSLGVGFKQVNPILEEIREEIERFYTANQGLIDKNPSTIHLQDMDKVNRDVVLARYLVFPETQGLAPISTESQFLIRAIDETDDFPLLKLVRRVR